MNQHECYEIDSCSHTKYPVNMPKSTITSRAYPMNRQSVWATKVAALIQSGNSQAAIAQIKVAPTVKDLQQLRKLVTALKRPSDRFVDEAIEANLALLNAPRLHRSP